MSILVAALTTGAGVNTPSGNQAYLEERLLIGDVDTANPLRGLKVNIDGDTTVDIQTIALVTAFLKFSNRIAGTVIGIYGRIATGRITTSKSVNLTFTNDAATTPAVMWNSQKTGGVPIRAQTTSINALANATYNGKDFAGLFITPAANVASFDLTMTDGTQQSLLVVEADANFASKNDTEANGRLDALVTGFDNMDGKIASVKVNATTAVTVMQMK